MTAPLLRVENLKVEYRSSTGSVTAIPDLSFDLAQGESFGIVGESGCGKSTLLMAIMGHLGPSGAATAGRVLFEGKDILTSSSAELRRMRGSGISMVYQDPNAALNPTLKIGRQLVEVPMLHAGVSLDEARSRAERVLADVHLPDQKSVMERFPHQLSGGQKQRVVIAMALLANPKLLLLDEPTTGLDVTVEAAVLDLIDELRGKYGTSLIYITHNVGVVAQVCDRVGVMYLGDLVEEAPVRALFASPRHPYTRRLMSCVPRLDGDKHTTCFMPIPGQPSSLRDRPSGCAFSPRCVGFKAGLCDRPVPVEEVEPQHRVRCFRHRETEVFDVALGEIIAPAIPHEEVVLQAQTLSKTYRLGSSFFGSRRGAELTANDDLNFSAKKSEIIAIVGESGSGKSTFARILAGLQDATSGRLVVLGTDLASTTAKSRTADQLSAVQMVFQNPDATLNPSHSAGFPVARALKKFGITSGRKATQARVAELFEMVRLAPSLMRMRPARLSGGQKQRVAIARAFAAAPDILVADEPVSALDVSVQAAIVNLLLQIQKTKGTTIVFISHDLALVRHLADQVIVMYLGKVMESGPVTSLFAPPFHPYTEALLSAVPVPDPTAEQRHIRLSGETPSPINVPKGCRFASRCPRKIGPICDDTPPPVRKGEGGHVILCHIPLAELAAVEPILQREHMTAAPR
ncbi:peptide/nickel transport system ATP-binding protein [Rhizobiales bacterium GAS188]|nr:peptide/nickel transport system ATP-binding protein [Rhizobiales bacterium GAS188]